MNRSFVKIFIPVRGPSVFLIDTTYNEEDWYISDYLTLFTKQRSRYTSVDIGNLNCTVIEKGLQSGFLSYINCHPKHPNLACVVEYWKQYIKIEARMLKDTFLHTKDSELFIAYSEDNRTRVFRSIFTSSLSDNAEISSGYYNWIGNVDLATSSILII